MTRQDPPVASGAGVGAAARTTCVAATSAGTTRTTAPTTSGSGLPAVKCHMRSSSRRSRKGVEKRSDGQGACRALRSRVERSERPNPSDHGVRRFAMKRHTVCTTNRSGG